MKTKNRAKWEIQTGNGLATGNTRLNAHAASVGLPPGRRWLSGETFEAKAIACLVPVMALCMIAEALRRHHMPECPSFTLRLAGGCLAWTASLGMANAVRTGAHLKVSLLQSWLARKPSIGRFVHLAMLVFFSVSFISGMYVFAVALIMPATRHPLVYLSLPVGSVFALFRTVQKLRNVEAV